MYVIEASTGCKSSMLKTVPLNIYCYCKYMPLMLKTVWDVGNPKRKLGVNMNCFIHNY